MNSNEETITHVNRMHEAVQELPVELEELNQEIEAAGGALKLAPDYDGSIGRTMFDTPSSEDGTLTVLMPREHLEQLPAQTMVRIKSLEDKRNYLGVVVEGPFAEPDGLRADSTPLVAVTLKGGILMPKFHGRAQIMLLSEELADGTTIPPRRRPLPNSPVFVLSTDETAAVLNTSGDISIGTLDGNDAINIKTSSKLKAVLPRHLGVLGTTGGGKSTTVSGLISQFQQAGIATVLFDTEGEYTTICDATDHDKMIAALKRMGREPSGVADTHLFVLTGRDTRNPQHPSITCVFRRNRTAIPSESERLFRFKANSRSERKRTPIPIETEQGFRRNSNAAFAGFFFWL